MPELGKKGRILNIIDDYNREALCVEPDYSQSGHSVVRCLNQLFQFKGKPEEIRCDNGPEFLSQVFTEYCAKEAISIRYIQPGKPTQNAYIERFNRSYREDVLDAYLFHTLEELQDLSFTWKEDYNANHPHQALNNLSPFMYLEQNQHL